MLHIYISSLVAAVVALTALAWKWNVRIRTAILGGIVIGVVTGFIVSRIDAATTGLNLFWLVVIELCFTGAITLLLILVRFYRDPERMPRETGNVIISPADGMVIYVNEVEKGTSLVTTKGKQKFELEKIAATNFVDNAAILLGIDMNVLNVHVNRAPIAGKVILCKRTKGAFSSLRRQDSEILNERVTTVIDGGTFKIGVIQISSRLVRRINTFVKEGDGMAMGQRLGAIVFGSQVDTIIPRLENLKIAVKPGDEVKAGVTVIARYG